MEFLIPFGLDLLLYSIKKLIESRRLKKLIKREEDPRKLRHQNAIKSFEEIDEEFAEEYPEIESPRKHPIYKTALEEWDSANNLPAVIKWHDKYTPELKINQYLYNYYPKCSLPQ